MIHRNGQIKRMEWLNSLVGVPPNMNHDSEADLRCPIVWTAFATEGIGVSIQHYQKEGLMKQINVEWGLPLHWDLKCQMPFGAPDGPPRGGVPKQFVPIEPRVKIIGGS